MIGYQTVCDYYAIELACRHPWEKAFQMSKKILISLNLLVYFNPRLRLIFTRDTSAYGESSTGTSNAGWNREANYICFTFIIEVEEKQFSAGGVVNLACLVRKKFMHIIIFGQPFELIIDHKPLLSLLNEHRALSPQAFLVLRGGPYLCYHTSTL